MSNSALWMMTSAFFYELHQIVDDVAEFRLVFEELAIDPVYRERAFVALALADSRTDETAAR